MRRRISAFLLAVMMVLSVVVAVPVAADGEYGPLSISAASVVVDEGTTTVEIPVTIGNIPTDLGISACLIKATIDNGAEVTNIVKLAPEGSGQFQNSAYIWADASVGIFTETVILAKIVVTLPSDAAPATVFTLELGADEDPDYYLTFNEDPSFGDTLGLGATGSTVTITIDGEVPSDPWALTLTAEDVTVEEGTETVEVPVTVGNIPTDLGLGACLIAASVDGEAAVTNIVKVASQGSGQFSNGAYIWADASEGIFDESVVLAKVIVTLPESAATGDTFTVTLSANDDPDYYLTFNDDAELGMQRGLGAAGSTAVITVGTPCDHVGGDPVIENEVDPTCTEGGSYDVVVYCTLCNREISRETVNTDPAGHTEGDVVYENVVEATCTEGGSHDEVVYCTVCEAELSRESVDDDPLGHTEGAPVLENVIDATCTEDGSAEEVIYCSVCEIELSREGIILLAHHTPGEPVIENEAPDGYDEVVYCTICSTEISRVFVPAIHDHIAGDPVIENEVEATIDEAGSYDLVEYCTICKTEMSRTTVEVPALQDQHFIFVPEVAPTHDKEGVAAHWVSVETGKAYNAQEGEDELNLEDLDNRAIDDLTDLSIPVVEDHIESDVVYENVVPATEDATGGYDEVTYCTVCGIEMSREHVVLPKLDPTHTEHTDTFTVRSGNLEFKPCEGGTYTLTTYCAECGAVVGTPEVITVIPATHTVSDAVYENQVDATCTEKGSYDVVYYCTVCGEEIARETLETPALGHIAGEDVLENVVESGCEVAGSCEVVSYCAVCGAELSRETLAIPAGHVPGSPVKEMIFENTCFEDGSYSLSTYCEACGKKLSSQIVVIPAAHVPAAAVVENTVAPTCVDAGSHDIVVYCSVCGGELSRRTVIDRALGHKGGETVIENVVEPTCVDDGSHDEVVYCTVCEAELSRENVDDDALGHVPGTPVVENEVLHTCETSGNYDSVVYCSVCGVELSREYVVIPPHTPGEPVIENYVAATCTDITYYDVVTYCEVCGEEITRRSVEEGEPLGHDPLDPMKENVVEHTCTEDGSYDLVVYCARCDAELSREADIVDPASHHNVETIENYVDATCTEDGGYDKTITCTVCGETLFVHVVIPAAHVNGEVVKENVVAATCTTAGSFDNVIYCTVCGAEIHRESFVTAALGHTQTTVSENAVAPTCTAAGSYESVVKCAVCGEEFSR